MRLSSDRLSSFPKCSLPFFPFRSSVPPLRHHDPSASLHRFPSPSLSLYKSSSPHPSSSPFIPIILSIVDSKAINFRGTAADMTFLRPLTWDHLAAGRRTRAQAAHKKISRWLDKNTARITTPAWLDSSALLSGFLFVDLLPLWGADFFYVETAYIFFHTRFYTTGLVWRFTKIFVAEYFFRGLIPTLWWFYDFFPPFVVMIHEFQGLNRNLTKQKWRKLYCNELEEIMLKGRLLKGWEVTMGDGGWGGVWVDSFPLLGSLPRSASAHLTYCRASLYIVR